MSTLWTWFWDCLWRSDSIAPKSELDSALGVIPKAVALLGTAFGADLLKVLAPGVPASRIVIVRVFFLLLLVVAAGYTLTAKEPAGASGGGSALRYKFSEAERWLARIVVAGFVVVSAANYWPQPETCRLQASIELPAPAVGVADPLYVLLQASGQEVERYPLRRGGAIAVEIAPDKLSAWSLALVWPDGKVSKFGPISGCREHSGMVSDDGLSKITLEAK